MMVLLSRLATDKHGKHIPIADFQPKHSKKPHEESTETAEHDGGARERKSHGLIPSILKSLRLVGQVIGAVVDAVLLSQGIRSEVKTLLKPSRGPFGVRKILALPSLPLSAFKSLKSKVPGATVNDVVLSVLGGGLHRYLKLRNDPAANSSSLQLHANVPFSLPRPMSASPLDSEFEAMHNLWTLLRVPLPAGVFPSPLDRLRAAKKIADNLKNSPTAIVNKFIAETVGDLLDPKKFEAFATNAMLSSSVLFTNVPGPQFELYIAGEPILEVRGAFPVFASTVAVVSYNHQVLITFSVSPAVVPGDAEFLDCFQQEFDAVLSA